RTALFFFSSRRRHTRLVSDWSSDVCSSDLEVVAGPDQAAGDRVEGQADVHEGVAAQAGQHHGDDDRAVDGGIARAARVERVVVRSEERRVGKEGRSVWGAKT